VSLDTSPLGRRAKLTFDDASYKRLLVNLKELPRRVGLRVLRNRSKRLGRRSESRR
jgi:hypothetical protein